MTIEDALHLIDHSIKRLNIPFEQRRLLNYYHDELVTALHEITPQDEDDFERIFRHINHE